MFKVFAFLTKREDLETEAFIDHYENNHVPLALSLAPAPTVYRRNYLVRGDEANRDEDSIDFDGFLDRSRTRAYVIDERT